jgi:4-hydroxybenzoate polyprenyltransferase
MTVADVVVSPRRGLAAAALVGMRPRQWSKNLLLFAGIVFAAEVGDAQRWLEAWAAFCAYCLASSAAYLGNDVRDAANDRAHPVKRYRPVASGELPARGALCLAAALGAAALGIAAALGPLSAAFMAGFLALQVGYTAGLKHVVLLDVMAIGGLFVIRAAAGAEGVDVPISPWLLLCTALLALFLALAKRRAELVLVGAEATPTRPVLEGYSLALVDQLVTLVAGSTVIAYSLYTFEAHHSRTLMLTIPFVLFGVFRYLLLVHRRDLGEEPEEIFLRDRPLAVAIAAWALACGAILAAT